LLRPALSSRHGPGDNAAGPATVEDRLRKALRLIVGIAVSVACLYFATKGTDWGEVAEVLAKTSLVWVGAVVVASVASLYIRAQRWRVLLRPLGDIPLYPALSATAIGFGASLAWQTRRLARSITRGALRNVSRVRDEHWLEKHPIDYA